MDIGNLAINGISIAALIMLVVQALKSFGITNTKTIQAIAFSLGVVLVGLNYGMQNGLIGEQISIYINWFVYSIMGGLSAMGLFDFVKIGLSKAS